VRELQYYAFVHYSPLPNIIFNSAYFHAHATKFEWMLDHDIENALPSFNDKFWQGGK
jgi:hypothetical protein